MTAKNLGVFNALEHSHAYTGSGLQGALIRAAQAGARVVGIPAGDWDCTDVDVIWIPEGITRLFGVGDATALYFAERQGGGQNIIAYAPNSPLRESFEITDMLVDGGSDGLPRPAGNFGASIRLNSYLRGSVRNVTVRNVEGFAVLYEDVQDVRGNGVRMEGTGRDGIQVAGSTRRARLSDISAVAIGDDCVHFSNTEDRDPTKSEAILNNFNFDPNPNGDHPDNKGNGVRVTGHAQVSITDGTVKNPVNAGVRVSTAIPFNTSTHPSSNVTVDNVTVDGVGLWGAEEPTERGDLIHAAFVIKDADMATLGAGCHALNCRDQGVVLVDCDQVKVAATVRDCGEQSDLGGFGGVEVRGGSRAHIVGASIVDNHMSGVRSSADELIIDSSMIDGNGRSHPNAQGSGVFYAGTGKLVVRSSQVTDNAGFGVHTINAPAVVNVQNNDVTDNALGGVAHASAPAFLVESGNTETVGTQPTSTY